MTSKKTFAGNHFTPIDWILQAKYASKILTGTFSKDKLRTNSKSNFKWSWLFFYLESPALALADLVLLLVSIVVTMALFWRHSQLATYLLLPYLGWVIYAFSLNLFIWKHN